MNPQLRRLALVPGLVTVGLGNRLDYPIAGLTLGRRLRLHLALQEYHRCRATAVQLAIDQSLTREIELLSYLMSLVIIDVEAPASGQV
jgi:hypothetical protein